MKKWLKITLIVLALVVVAGGVFLYNAYQDAQTTQAAFDPSSLETVALEMGILESTVDATGNVRTAQNASLTWKTSGTIEEVLVSVGDTIEKGQELAVLEATSLPSSVILAELDIATAQQALEDLLEPPTELEIVQAEEAIIAAQEVVDDAQYALDTLLYYEPSELDIAAAEADVAMKLDALERAQEKFAPYENKHADNAMRQRLLTQLQNAQEAYDAVVITLNYLLTDPSEATIAAVQSDLAVAQAQLEAAQEDYEDIFGAADSLEVQKLEAEIVVAQATLETARLTAPFGGTVTELSMLPGDQVNSGTVALRLDNLDIMLVDMEVSELDINQVHDGQPANLVFDAILGSEYMGEVVEVGIIGSESSNVVTYPVTVAITDPDEAIRPGMTAVVSVVISQAAEALLIPNQAVTVLNGQQVVYVMGGGTGMGMTPVEVVLGMSSDTYSILIQGELAAGDRILLNPMALLNAEAQAAAGGMGIFGIFGGGGERQPGSGRPEGLTPGSGDGSGSGRQP